MSGSMAIKSALCAVAVLATAAPGFAQAPVDRERPEPKRPSLSLKATPGTGMVPVRVSASAELKGGTDDFQDYYCPSIEWIWGDGTVSEVSADCEPYEPGVSQIRRRYTVSHNYTRAGVYRIVFRLKMKGRIMAAQTIAIRLLGGGE